MHLGWTSTAAVGSLRIRRHADRPSIPASSRELALGLTIMLLMTEQALLHARLMSMPSSFAPMPKGNTSFSHSNVSCISHHFSHGLLVNFIHILSSGNVSVMQEKKAK